MTGLSMNELIRREADRGRHDGLLDRLRGTGRLDDDRQERLNRQMANYEDAVRRGDDVAAVVADHAIDTLLNEAREARAARAQAVSQASDSSTLVTGRVEQQPTEPKTMNGILAALANGGIEVESPESSDAPVGSFDGGPRRPVIRQRPVDMNRLILREVIGEYRRQ